MGLLLGTDPVVLVVPAHAGVMAQRDVVHVEEDLVTFLPVPDLVAEVARVLEDRSDRGVSPRRTVLLPMRIATRVARAGGEDPFDGEHRRDRVQAVTADELTEDATHHRGRHGVGFEAVQTATVAGLARVRVRARVSKAIAERRSATLEPALDRDLGLHRGPDAGLDAVAFAFAHAAVERHDDFVRVTAGIDCASDLRNPELHAVVNEDREGQAELVAVERSLRFADDDGVETAIGVGEGLEETGGFRSSRPRQRA